MAPSRRMIGSPDDERDPKYVPPDTFTPTLAFRATLGTPQKVAFSVVTGSQSDEERTLTGSQSGSASSFDGVSGFEEALG